MIEKEGKFITTVKFGVVMLSNKYRIDEKLVHKKELDKKTLFSKVIEGKYSAISWTGEFFHYTSPEGLRGILQSRTLFFTDCQYLNDYTERFNINKELDLFWCTYKHNYDEAFLKLIINIRVDNFEDAGFLYMDKSAGSIISRYFVLSTSQDNDSLSMWKYYAKNNTYNGYCLGLATWALTDEWIDCETGVSIEMGEIIYSSVSKQEKILEAVEKLYLLWCIYKKSCILDKKITEEFKSWLYITALFFKNESFAPEKEYRFIAIVPVDKLKKYNSKKYKMYDFHIIDGAFTPFIKMPFNLWNVDKCRCVTSIGIGPAKNSANMANGLRQFLNSLDYEIEDCKIYHSKIPLRY